MFIDVPYSADGFKTTCLLFLLTLAGAIPLGLLISFCTMSRIRALRLPFKVFVWIIRGVPLMLQLFIVYYVPGFILGYTPYDRFTAVAVAFIINYACYFSEIYRSGIQSVPQGQTEDGQVLGMTRPQIFPLYYAGC